MTLTHIALALLILNAAACLLTCACVLAAPHTSSRTGNAGSIVFSLLAGVTVGAAIAMGYQA